MSICEQSEPDRTTFKDQYVDIQSSKTKQLEQSKKKVYP